jgi:hypothetical protein
VEPEKQPLLANGSETFVSRQLGKHVPLETGFILGPCKEVIRNKTEATKSVPHVRLRGKDAVGGKPPFREDLSAEAEEFPLLEAATRERLVKTHQVGKDLAGALGFVNCGD